MLQIEIHKLTCLTIGGAIIEVLRCYLPHQKRHPTFSQGVKIAPARWPTKRARLPRPASPFPVTASKNSSQPLATLSTQDKAEECPQAAQRCPSKPEHISSDLPSVQQVPAPLQRNQAPSCHFSHHSAHEDKGNAVNALPRSQDIGQRKEKQQGYNTTKLQPPAPIQALSILPNAPISKPGLRPWQSLHIRFDPLQH